MNFDTSFDPYTGSGLSVSALAVRRPIAIPRRLRRSRLCYAASGNTRLVQPRFRNPFVSPRTQYAVNRSVGREDDLVFRPAVGTDNFDRGPVIVRDALALALERRLDGAATPRTFVLQAKQ